MKKILITGANSFIGSYFSEASSDYEVTEYDIERLGLDALSLKGYDVVFHVAAIVHQDASISDDVYFYVNRDLAFKLAQKAKSEGVTQFIFMSTVKVYGENTTIENPWTELSDCHPQDAYGKSKLEAEKLLLSLNESAFKVLIIRTPVVYGQGVKGNVQRIAKMMLKLRLVPLGGIHNKRAMIYIGNLIYIVQRGIESQASDLILAAEGQGYSTSEFVKFLANSTVKRIVIITLPKLIVGLIKSIRPSLYQKLFGSLVLDNSKSQEKLSLKLPYSPEEGFKEVMKAL